MKKTGYCLPQGVSENTGDSAAQTRPNTPQPKDSEGEVWPSLPTPHTYGIVTDTEGQCLIRTSQQPSQPGSQLHWLPNNQEFPQGQFKLLGNQASLPTQHKKRTQLLDVQSPGEAEF